LTVHGLQLTIKGLNVTAVKNKKAFSLAEIMVVIAIIAILATVVIPAAKTMVESFEMSSQINPVIGAALANARALAMKEQKYAGIRFQQDLSGSQYMILIIHDDIKTGLAYGFRAVQGRKPMKLPEAIGVMDFMVKDHAAGLPAEFPVATDTDINDPAELVDVTSFSIVFSPAGKLIIHPVRVRNRDGLIDSDSAVSDDDVFNTLDRVDIDGVGKFVQDDYLAEGWYQEFSRKSFVVYKKSRLKEIRPDRRWSTYLEDLERNQKVYVNPYSGHMISD